MDANAPPTFLLIEADLLEIYAAVIAGVLTAALGLFALKQVSDLADFPDRRKDMLRYLVGAGVCLALPVAVFLMAAGKEPAPPQSPTAQQGSE